MDSLIIIFIFGLITFSIIGWGLLLIKIIDKNIVVKNLGLVGLCGLFSLTLLSYATHLVIPHGYSHNIIIILFGLLYFFFSIKKNNYKQSLIIICLLFLILISGLFVEKNHDDFPYYHLQYSLQLVENKIQFGLGNLEHGWRHHSSIFFLNSLFYLPYIKFYLFHTSGLITLLFVNSFIIFEIIQKYKSKQFSFYNFFYLMVFAYINSKFYNIGNYGTDISGQLIILILIPSFFQFFEKKMQNNQLKIHLILFLYLITLKVFFLTLLIFPLFLLFLTQNNKKVWKIYFESRIFILGTITFSFLFFYNLAYTGCLVYPISQSCFKKENISWSLEKKEVKRMKVFIEGWSKAGATVDYKEKIALSEYNSNFNWIKGWTERYFFNKGLENFLAIIFLCIIFIALLKSIKIEKQTKQKKIFLFLVSIIFIEWFFNHPQFRYGGYSAVGLFLFTITNNILVNRNLKLKTSKTIFTSLIVVSLIIFNVRNIDRILNHFQNDQFKNFPFFYIPNVEYESLKVGKNIYISIAIDNACWGVKTPCSGTRNINALNKNNFIIYSRKD